MILAASRRRGLEFVVRFQQQSVSGRQNNAVRKLQSRSIVSSQSSSVSDTNTSTSMISASHQDNTTSTPQSQNLSSSWQEKTRIYHESPPSRQLKLKVPPRRGFIRAKSSSVNIIYETPPPYPSVTPGTIDHSSKSRRRSLPRRQQSYNMASSQPEFESGFLSDLALKDATAVESEPSPITVVDAYYAAKEIDLAPLIISTFAKDSLRQKYSKDSLVVQLSPTPGANANANNNNNNQKVLPSFVAVYRFGSIIFLNVGPREKAKLLESVKRHAIEPIGTGFEQRDSFAVCVTPEISRTRVTSEHAIVHELNLSAVAVISEVMAQSVALDSYNDIVDSLLENFAIVNSKISTTNQMDMDKKMIFSKIAQNNRIFIDLISKLRIKGRSQIAWDEGEYELIHSGMTTEFDIDDRFELIQFKLDLIQQNSKLFLEVIHHQKSASVEWIIVGLIGVECVLMCLDMSGQGTVMFEYAKNLVM